MKTVKMQEQLCEFCHRGALIALQQGDQTIREVGNALKGEVAAESTIYGDLGYKSALSLDFFFKANNIQQGLATLWTESVRSTRP